MAIVLLRLILIAAVVIFGLYLTRRFKAYLATVGTDPAPKSDPFAVLGLSTKATPSEIKEAYRRLIAQYHPDKVAHLGPELQTLAELKTLEIVSAYNRALKKRS